MIIVAHDFIYDCMLFVARSLSENAASSSGDANVRLKNSRRELYRLGREANGGKQAP